MSRKLIYAICLVMFGSVGAAEAQWKNGNQLFSDCQKNTVYAYNYIFGVVDGFNARNVTNRPFCVPEQAVGEQLFDVACNYVRDHPEDRSSPASFLVLWSFMKAWPCR